MRQGSHVRSDALGDVKVWGRQTCLPTSWNTARHCRGTWPGLIMTCPSTGSTGASEQSSADSTKVMWRHGQPRVA